jgi:hypothetical protein
VCHRLLTAEVQVPSKDVHILVDKVAQQEVSLWELQFSPTNYHFTNAPYSSNIGGLYNRPIWAHSTKGLCPTQFLQPLTSYKYLFLLTVVFRNTYNMSLDQIIHVTWNIKSSDSSGLMINTKGTIYGYNNFYLPHVCMISQLKISNYYCTHNMSLKHGM